MNVLSRRPVGILCSAAFVAPLCGGWGLVTAQEVAERVTSTLLHADASQALDAMAKEAKSRNMKGVAVVAFVSGDKTQDWVSHMRVVDAMVLGKANVLGVAYCKLSEMADTLKDSGSKVRPALHGELGYRGGAIRKVHGGYLLAAFSGGKDTDDLAVANVGLDVLERKSPSN
jgi:hypothetical protein